MKKKSTRVLLISVIIAILLVGIAGVALIKFGTLDSIFETIFNTKSLLPSDSKVSADDNPFLVDKGFGSPEITLDGVLDEEQWKGKKELIYGSTYNTTIKGFYGKAGIYISAVVTDNDLCAKNANVWSNTSFELYVDKAAKGGERTDSNQMQFFLDVKEGRVTRVGYEGSWSDTELIFNYGVTVDGTIDDKEEDKGYCMEMFIPYSQLGTDMTVDYGIAFGTVCCTQGLRSAWYGLPGADPQIPETYYIFDRETNVIAPRPKVNKAKYKIDGKADDTIWNNRKPFKFGTGGYGAVSSYVASEGLYFFFEMQDDKVCGKGSVTYKNDSVEVYLDTLNNAGKKPQKDDFQIRVDVNGNIDVLRGTGKTWAGCKDNVIAGIQQTTTGYNIEVFVPWSDLKVEKVPKSVGINLGTVDWDGAVSSKGEHAAKWSGIKDGVNPQIPDTYYVLYCDTNIISLPPKVNYAKQNVDGKDNDSIWNNRESLSFGSGGRGRVSNYFADEGLYFFFEMQDNKVCAEGTSPTNNDSVEMYIDTLSDGGKKPQKDDYQIRVDVDGNIELWVGNGTNWTPIRDNVFAGIQKRNNGYDVEVFIPWSDLGLEKAPKSMKVSFGTVDWDGVKNSSGKRVTQWSGFGSNPQVPDTYTKMTKNSIDIPKNTDMLIIKTPATPASEVKLDGVFDDKLWDNAQLFAYSGLSVKVQYVWTDNGCYVGFTVTDDNVSTASTSWVSGNSSLEMYLDYQNNDGKPDSKDRTIIVDAAGNTEFRMGVDGEWKVFIGSAIQSRVKRTQTGYNVEMYIPWCEFGGKRPKTMGVAFGQVTRLDDANQSRCWYHDGLCVDPAKPALYSDFTATKITDVKN